MKHGNAKISILSMALLTAVGMAVVPAASMAADEAFAEWEIRREQELARRDIEARERALADALRGQQEAIRQLEATSSRLESSAQQNAREQLEQSRNYNPPYPPGPLLAPLPPEAQAQMDSRHQVDAVSEMTLVLLTDRLGSYFGTSSGVLVARTGSGAPFGLQDGDVLLSIDSRVPADGEHAARILRSYRPGEPVKLRVQRDRRAIDLDVTAPGPRRD